MIHAIERARERYGLDLTVDDLKAIVSACAAGDGVLLGRVGDGLERWLVRSKGAALVALVNIPEKFVVSILPHRSGSYLNHGRSPKNQRRLKRKRQNLNT